ncbi:glycosyltransferase family 4 protein [Trichothermofontia sp.]
MTIAYLINQYPKVSHSFIRREILSLEATGIRVSRFTIRPCQETLVDPADVAELAKTKVVLSVGMIGLLIHCFRVVLSRPHRYLQALILALKLSQRAEKNVLYHLIYLAEACVLLRWFQADQITHVHAHFGTNSTTVALLCQALGGPPYSFTVHGPEEFDKPVSLSLTLKIAQARFVVAVSSFGRSQLYRWCPYEQWSKIQVVHCGVDQQFLTATPTPIPDRPHLVCVGRLCEQKGQLLLVYAAQQLAQAGVDFQLTLVGDGPLRSELTDLISQYRLDDRLHITGWASGDQVQAALLAARALVLPSFAEGLPVVIMEALALGRPVISTYIAGIPELVIPSVNGWLVPAGSVPDLVAAMQQALTLPTARLGDMGKAGSQVVKQQHDTAIAASRLAQLFAS